MSVQWLGSITMDQIQQLENHSAVLTEDGWVIPEWLQWLRAQAAVAEYKKKYPLTALLWRFHHDTAR